MKMLLRIFAIVFSIIISAHAETDLNQAKSFQNPLGVNPEARYFTLPIINYNNFKYGSSKNTQNILEFKPVTPFSFTESFDIIFRTFIPLLHQPDNPGYQNGLGDINPTAFITPAKNSWFIWGVGPSLVIPSATNHVLGSNLWSLGPELTLIAMPDKWTFALLTSNIWSFSNPSNPNKVNQFSFEYFITYNLSPQWYVTTQPTLVANWLEPAGQKWTVPFGLGVGRLLSYGDQKMNFLVQAYYNVKKPDTTQQWTLQATLEFLFPDNSRGI